MVMYASGLSEVAMPDGDVFKEVDLSTLASSLGGGVIPFIDQHLSEGKRREFHAELEAVLKSAPPDQASTDPQWVSRTMKVHENVVRALRAWHVSVVVHADETWMREIRAGEGGDYYTAEDVAAIGPSRDESSVGQQPSASVQTSGP